MIQAFCLSTCSAWLFPLLFGQSTDQGISGAQYTMLAVAAATFVVPFVVGSILAKGLKMPTYGMRIGFIVFALLSSALVLTFGTLRYGVDIRGGTILVYELDPKATIQRSGDEGQSEVTAADVVPSLIKRINPSGTEEIVIRPYGDTQIEIIIPDVQEDEVNAVKRQITEAGILRFAIVANTTDHQSLIQTARTTSLSGNRLDAMQRVLYGTRDQVIGFWADVDRETVDSDGVAPLRVDVFGGIVRDADTGQFVNLPFELAQSDDPNYAVAEYLKNEGIDSLQILMVVNELTEVTGEDLAFVSQGYDESGGPSVRFSLKDSGSGRFARLTGDNAPDPDGRFRRRLGIVLDDRLLSAPAINEAISGEGTISGRFTNEEVAFLVNILRAGQLPAALNKVPTSENRIGSTLGADTIKKGITSIGVSLGLVLLFVLFYYRFAGFVACFALLLNLAMIVAMMILINQPLTLPGLAGLVLTVGMSVDANVLIFERIREEVVRGAAPRMAVRNGFSRATTTIIDSNLTTLITGLVLYAIGTDQIRGFSVTLVLGILFSMFTAIYVSRTVFDIGERRGILSLGMSDLVTKLRKTISGQRDIDFIGASKIGFAVSTVLIVVGVTSLVMRGRDILDIDFAGGSSVTFQLEQPMDAEDVRRLVASTLESETDTTNTQFTLNRVDVEGAPANTVYKVDAAFDDDEKLKEVLSKGFLANGSTALVTYLVEILPEGARESSAPEQPAEVLESSPGPAPTDTGRAGRLEAVQLVSFQPPASDAAVAQESDAGETESVETAVASNESASQDDSTNLPEPASNTPAPSDVLDSASQDAAPSTPEVPTTVSETVVSSAEIALSIKGTENVAKMNHRGLLDAFINAGEEVGLKLEERAIDAFPVDDTAAQWAPGSNLGFSRWNVTLELPAEQADQVFAKFQETVNTAPFWLSSSEIKSQVAKQMVNRAVAAMIASLLFIAAYIWFRFQKMAFGLAAVVALIHDVVVTLGAIAVSAYLASALGFLQVEPFKISLTVVAALLTIVGYSLNDTIVIFDRIRETRGKSPRLTGEMINASVNATLSRTLLTSITTLIVVVLLYFFGGAGIHAFAFALVVGVLVGTYSSIFVASPFLLWFANRNATEGNR